jgi:hypothetical protein
MGADIWMGFGRHILTMLGGVLVSKGYIDASTLDQVIGAVLTLVGFWWSYTHKVSLATVLATSVAPAAPVVAAPQPATSDPGKIS